MHRKLSVAFIFAGMLAACASTSTDSLSGRSPASTPPPTQTCQATKVKLKGQPANQSNLQRAQQQAGAETLRVIRPDSMYTTDYNPQRLSVRVDEAEKIQDAYCG